MNWIEEYRPRHLNEIVGNKQSISKLNNWINDFLKGRTKKAALLYGPTGVGKTSSVYAVANEFDLDVIELNASDQRNYLMIKKIAGSAIENYSINQKNKIILFDEADNLYGVSDKSGARGIREIIEKSSYPVILTANILKKVPKDVKNLCITIKFDQLKEPEILSVLKNICVNEKIDVDIQVLRKIAKNNQDFRAAINDLYALTRGITNLKNSTLISTSEREHTEDIYSLLMAIFNGEDYLTLAQKLYKIDETPEDVIQWINENIFEFYEEDAYILSILDCLSASDIYLSRTYKRQNYKFWRYANDLMLLGVHLPNIKNQKRFIYIKYPKRWILSGRFKQKKDLMNNVCFKIAKTYNISMKKAKSQILPFLKKICNDNVICCLKNDIGLTDKEISLLFNINNPKKSYHSNKKGNFKGKITSEGIKKNDIKKENIQKSLFDF